MQNQLVPFQFNGQSIRAFTDENGNPWFVAKDVCQILELGNPTEAIRSLDDDEKADLRIPEVSSNGIEQARNMNVISESGLYSLIFRSRKSEARRFRKWVTSEVLPILRKTGSYTMPGLVPDQTSPRREGMTEAIRILEQREKTLPFSPVVTEARLAAARVAEWLGFEDEEPSKRLPSA